MQSPQLQDALRPDQWPVRPARAAVAAVAVTVTAVGGHVAGGGETSAWIVVALTTGAFMVALGLAGHRLTMSQLVGLLLLGQAVVHLACMSAAPAPMSTSMVVGHVAATAIAATLMRRGEDLMFDLADRFRRFIAPSVPVFAAIPRTAAATPTTSCDPKHLLLAFVVDGRGPPLRRPS